MTPVRSLFPWFVAVVTTALIAGQVAVYFAPEKPAGAYTVVPIRPPLTMSEDDRNLMISEDHPPSNPSPEDDASIRMLADKCEAARRGTTEDGRAIGAVLTMDQLLFIFSQRDRLVRDEYEGRAYDDLVRALEAIAGS